MKIFLINLDRADDRRGHMLSELSRLVPDIPVERALCVDIKAADWKAPDTVKPGRWSSDRWSLGPSDIEIFRSHIDCWEKIVAAQEYGVILEDDLLFSAKFAGAITGLEAAKTRGIVRLDGLNRPVIHEKTTQDLGEFRLSPLGSLAASAGAYLLDPHTASLLLETAKIERTVDDYLFDPTPEDRGARGHGLSILQLEPAVAVQAQFGTYADAGRKVPPFLEATKRVDAKNRKARAYLGPWPYRVRKEILRARYRKRLKLRIQTAQSNGGRWGAPELCSDLAWD